MNVRRRVHRILRESHKWCYDDFGHTHNTAATNDVVNHLNSIWKHLLVSAQTLFCGAISVTSTVGGSVVARSMACSIVACCRNQRTVGLPFSNHVSNFCVCFACLLLVTGYRLGFSLACRQFFLLFSLDLEISNVPHVHRTNGCRPERNRFSLNIQPIGK